jgi:CRP/FNR family transcriptional regulator, cyclic AMP receptor protein
MPRSVHILGLLRDEDIAWIAQAGLRVSLTAGQPLVEEGRRNSFLHIIITGAFLVTSRSTGDRQISVMQRGEVIGELSFLDARPPSATVRAVRASQVLAIARSEVTRKLEADLAFASRFYRALGITLATRLRALTRGAPSEEEFDMNVLEQGAVDEERFEAILRTLAGE